MGFLALPHILKPLLILSCIRRFWSMGVRSYLRNSVVAMSVEQGLGAGVNSAKRVLIQIDAIHHTQDGQIA